MAGTLAIDLGSSTTVVAWQQGDAPPRLLELPPYSCGSPAVVPSLLWLAGRERPPLIGRQVLEAGLAERGGPQLCRDFKRRIGADAAIPEEPSPERAGALLLQARWRALPADIEPHRLVLTAPIDTYRGYRRWLQQVCRELPVAELALVDEPTAAAIGAGLPAGSRVLVLDLGGGTVDLSLVALEGGEGRAAPIAQLLRFAGRDLERSGQALRTARVIGKAGLSLGGRDLDRWIAAALCPDQPAEGALLEAAERLKCRLSEAEEALELCSLPGQGARELRLSRGAFERLLEERGLLERL
ncbi:MAG: Hsp70 family protein, partial [Cyanobium sp.]